VIIDASHRRWMLATAASTALALFAFFFLRARTGGWQAGGALGLLFGAAAAGLLVFEALLALRKARPALRLGRASSWGRAHLWLGTLVLVFSLVHAGFRVRGTASVVLMVLLVIVSASGLVGLALQHLLPRMMTDRLPRETVYEQIPQLLEELRKDAAELVKTASDEALTRFYNEQVEPFLVGSPRGHKWLEPGYTNRVFNQFSKRLPQQRQEALADLRDITEERAQLFVQERLQLWLHGWVLVHAPLSYALLILLGAHAVMALWY
jgi:hypothetical protein